MYPLSPYDTDNHVVCEAYCAELNRWVLLDPTYDSFVFDESGEPIGVIETRRRLARRLPIAISDGANHNGETVDVDEIREYYAKNMFWFMVSVKQGASPFGSDGGGFVIVTPVGFDWCERMCLNADYCSELWGGESESMRRMFRDIERSAIRKPAEFLS